jgi:hypothetical protein
MRNEHHTSLKSLSHRFMELLEMVNNRVMSAYGKSRLNMEISLYTFLQILSVSVFEKVDILQLVTNSSRTAQEVNICNQLNLFDL